MRLLTKLLVAFAVVWGAHHWWAGRGGFNGLVSDASAHPGGAFVEVVRPDGFPERKVVIMAPENCPSDAAQRAESLYAKLQQAGVPVEKRSEFGFSAGDDSSAEMRARFDATLKVANGPVPVVFVGNVGASNPDFDSVVAEYRRLSPQKP